MIVFLATGFSVYQWRSQQEALQTCTVVLDSLKYDLHRLKQRQSSDSCFKRKRKFGIALTSISWQKYWMYPSVLLSFGGIKILIVQTNHPANPSEGRSKRWRSSTPPSRANQSARSTSWKDEQGEDLCAVQAAFSHVFLHQEDTNIQTNTHVVSEVWIWWTGHTDFLSFFH